MDTWKGWANYITYYTFTLLQEEILGLKNDERASFIKRLITEDICLGDVIWTWIERDDDVRDKYIDYGIRNVDWPQIDAWLRTLNLTLE